MRLAGSTHWSKEFSLESTGQAENILIMSKKESAYEVTLPVVIALYGIICVTFYIPCDSWWWRSPILRIF